MLLVDHHHAETGELYGVFDDGVRTYEYLYGAVEQPFERLLATPAFDDARQQGHAHVHAL